MKTYIFILTAFVIFSCNDKSKDTDPEFLVGFNWEIDDLNYKTVQFTNKSKNADRFSWDFGNGETSNLVDPKYTYKTAGQYDVTLTAFGADNLERSLTQTITLNDIPTPPSFHLSGNESKKWKLYRVDAAASLGPDSSQPNKWWEGLYNDGSRPCLYKHEFTFYADNSFAFEDNNQFWGDSQIWSPEDSVYETCFEPTESNMIVKGSDLSAWLSGSYSYEFDTSAEMIILRGKGAWMGFPFLGTNSNHGINLPDSVAFKINIEQMSNFDLMTINFDHGEDGFWTSKYASYENWNDEPMLIE
ncbi:PKD domain-containing protein [Marivirga sp.]|uniref:PKD domain-containing protein n=1 Tax=Marivirga sp. TaxID=2018662 RepID=UPI0025D09D35|nr:PKD domain-containing protein [Marivirga sp.]